MDLAAIAEENEGVQTEHNGPEIERPTEREMTRKEPAAVRPLQQEEKKEYKDVLMDLEDVLGNEEQNKSSILEVVEADLGKSASLNMSSFQLDASQIMNEEERKTFYRGGGAVQEEPEEIFVMNPKKKMRRRSTKTKKDKVMSKIT